MSRPWARWTRKTGKITEYSIPIQKPGWPMGELGLETDRDGNLWFGMTYQAGVAKFDRKTEKFQIFLPPAEYNKDMTQINMAAPQSSHVDGKLWSQNNGFAVIHRYDIATGQTETFAPFKNSKEGENHNIYDVIPGRAEQRLLHGFRARAHRAPGRQDRRDFAVADSDQEFRAAPWADGCRRAHLVRRVSREPHRHVRHQDRKVPGVASAHSVERSLRRDHG